MQTPSWVSIRAPRTTNRPHLRFMKFKIFLGPAWFLNCPWNHEHFQSWFARLWNHKLKPFLQANIIEGIKLYGDKGNEWDDIITFIVKCTQDHARFPFSIMPLPNEIFLV